MTFIPLQEGIPKTPPCEHPAGSPRLLQLRGESQRIRPMNLDPERAELVDRDFKHTSAHFNTYPDAPLTGNERLLLDPSNPLPDPTHEVITDDTGTRVVEVTQEKRQAHAVRTLLKQGHDARELTLDDLLPQRIKVAHRLVREMGRIRGLVQPNETLEDALKPREFNIDPWIIPERYNKPTDRRHSFTDILDAILDSEELPAMYWMGRWSSKNGEWERYPGVALLPPAIPRLWTDEEGNALPGYDPYDDKLLMAYMTIMCKTADRLCIEQGSRDDPHLGQYAMSGLASLDLIRLAFPTKLQLITWDHILIDQVLDLLVDRSERAARKALFYMYGFVEHEIDSLIKLAQARAIKQHCGDQDINRAVVILKIEDYIRRCREGLNVTQEMKGLKELALVMGLTSEQQDSMIGDLVSLMTKINGERRAEIEAPRRIVENTAGMQVLPPGVMPPSPHQNGAPHV